MDSYHIALFFHLVALMLAAGATAVTKIAAVRRANAKTVGDALDWHNVLASTSRLFPISLIVFVATGGYMLSAAHIDVSSGFVVAGLVGSILLFASGGYLGAKGGELKKVLEQITASGADQPAPKMVPPTLVGALPLVNTGIALAVVFDMAVKPSVAVSLGVLVLGIVLGAVKGLQRPTIVPAPAQMRRTVAY